MAEERRLSGEEQRAKMKEQFKKDLQQRQEFLKKVQGLRSQQNILKALEGMNVEDDTDEWIRKLDEQTAFREAKMEIALSGLPVDPAPEKDHTADMEKIVAQEMVRKMKEEMSGEKETPTSLTPSQKPLVDLDAPLPDMKDKPENPERKMLDGVE